ANKSTLLLGERALPIPEPGLGPKDGEKPRNSAPRRPKPRIQAASTAAKASTPAPPAPPRPSIEVIKGAKKENVDFP
ncbi:MAG TPA: hypothetical protein VFM63_13060, partial [Pyrinomonadaceae bacterium]|nr:hypothetical protein [Pyrinomonadaceae bacterium]